MTEGSEGNKNAKGWIVCRSQKRPERLYDFNTETGEAVWRDPETTTHHLTIMDKDQFDCPEPTEPTHPPLKPKPYRHHNAPPSSAPKIYNKQIINNQFPAKSFAGDPFVNAACAPYGFFNQNNAICMSAPQVWVTPPPVFMNPPVTPLNQLPTMYSTQENIQSHNTSLTLSNRFQVLKQMNDETHIDSNLLKGDNRNFKNCNPLPPRRNQNLNKLNDLRSLLSSRRRWDPGNAQTRSDTRPNHVHENHAHRGTFVQVDNPETKDVSARLSEYDLNPDDTDKWLEAHTDGEGKRLNVAVGCLWDLADSDVSRDCWYIIPTVRALLNNMRLLTSLVISDERLRLLAPRDVVRALRSAAFSDDGRLADCASRARTFVIRQMSKIPNTLKDAANIKSCWELIGPNTHAIHLIDEKEAPNNQCTNLQITPTNLKRCLESTMNSKPEMQKVQKISMGTIKISIPNEEAKGKADSPPRFNPTATTPATQPTGTERADLNSSDKTGVKGTDTKTDLTTSPPKLTVNACVQTDIDLSTDLNLLIKPKVSNISQVAHAAVASSDSVATKVPTRKIRLRRKQSTTTGTSNEIKTFRWRKRKDTALRSSEMLSLAENCNKTCSRGSPPPSSTSDLLAQQNDNAVDCERSDSSVQAKTIDESSTSAVISNSIDSETMFKINKSAILSASRTGPPKEIDMYDITDDCMADRLSIRRDEWVSRFVQVMEEVLSQVLQLDPPFADSTLPPPWTFQEATVCVKRKLKEHSIIVEASDKLDGFLMKLKYDRGNIETRISPTDFMLMYSYGVNLVNKLQLVLENCEDLHIASQNLSKLLSDIRHPNLDESEMDNFNCDDAMDYSPHISETVTNASTIEARDYTAPTTPQKQRRNISCNDSPARYSLRSSRSAEKQREKTEAARNKDYTLFASLGLEKNKFIPEKSIQKTISNPPKVSEHLTPPLDKAQGSVPDVQENSAAQVEPKIIRNFSILPQIENKLKGINYANAEGDAQNNADYEYSADDYGADKNAADDYAPDGYVDISGDGNANAETHNDDNCDDVLRMAAMDAEQNFESKQASKSGDLNANKILKLFVHLTTSKYRKCLVELHKFCQDTNTSLKSNDCSLNVMEKIMTVSEHAKNVCNRLKSVLNRDPCVTRDIFRGLMQHYGIQDFVMNDTQLAEYRVIIEKYSEVAEHLSVCVSRLADAVKVN